jgi:hypothetical protein
MASRGGIVLPIVNGYLCVAPQDIMRALRWEPQQPPALVVQAEQDLARARAQAERTQQAREGAKVDISV